MQFGNECLPNPCWTECVFAFVFPRRCEFSRCHGTSQSPPYTQICSLGEEDWPRQSINLITSESILYTKHHFFYFHASWFFLHKSKNRPLSVFCSPLFLSSQLCFPIRNINPFHYRISLSLLAIHSFCWKRWSMESPDQGTYPWSVSLSPCL